MSGGDPYFDRVNKRQSATAVGTTTGVSTTVSAPAAGYALVCSGIQCSGDAAAVVTIESPANTVLWRKRFAAAFAMSETFSPGSILGATAGAMLVKISASTANCEANIQTYTVTP